MRIAVIDSGVHADHPHVRGVAGGVSITPDGSEDPDFVDKLGHGTAVTAAIREKAPDADLFAVKIFHRSLTCSIECLVAAIDWSIRNDMHLINLSLGTNKSEHETVLQAVVQRAVEKGSWIIAAHEDSGVRWLPGCLPGVVPVALDWDCPREQYRITRLPDGRTLFHASGLPRPIQGVPPERNLRGISFAVANVTGLLAKEFAEHPDSLAKRLWPEPE
jgi:hypothetical protein